MLACIYDAALAKARETGKHGAVIGVAGAGCIGKTALCHRFRSYAGDSQCQVVSLDGFMLEREKRDKLGGLTGYNPDGFELAKAASAVSGLIHNQTSFTLRQYDRRLHRRTRPVRIEPRRFLLIEGGLALTEGFYSLEDLHVFLDADRQMQYELRLRREQAEFGYSATLVAERFERYFSDYLRFIHPQIELADLVLEVGTDYSLSFGEGRG